MCRCCRGQPGYRPSFDRLAADDLSAATRRGREYLYPTRTRVRVKAISSGSRHGSCEPPPSAPLPASTGRNAGRPGACCPLLHPNIGPYAPEGHADADSPRSVTPADRPQPGAAVASRIISGPRGSGWPPKGTLAPRRSGRPSGGITLALIATGLANPRGPVSLQVLETPIYAVSPSRGPGRKLCSPRSARTCRQRARLVSRRVQIERSTAELLAIEANLSKWS
jgi:hypothetical protein